MTKENAQLADIEKEKETNTSEIKATDAKIREIGVEYMKKVCSTRDSIGVYKIHNDIQCNDAMYARLHTTIYITYISHYWCMHW